ncbi:MULTISPECIES: glycosyltransferase [Acinetobacter]|uniref:glycosyltransferase n=1 Tax=Acinetobacter TaxID=469 RepID=UPI000450C083|nr:MULTISPECIES: glycosyltransferase [Acinetobacter]EXB32977.1 glycosyl transferase 2 family protein [Acinetobacter sp. 1461402]EXB72344.1 glycosyl transferase 2 family protein [Acinetobacter sp. 230853]
MSLEQSNPLVTVYIPTFNRVDLLKRAVESVRQQTYQNLEVIIVDDCSNDGTHKYLEEISGQDSRIQYFLKDKNSGACVSRNIAIENAKGEFITGLDDDDYFEKNRIEVFLNAIKKKPHNAFFSASKIKVNKDNIIQFRSLNIFKILGVKKYNKLLKQNFIGNQIFIKTEHLKKAGGFDVNLKAWQDLECWFNLMKKEKIKFTYLPIPTQVIDISHPHERITIRNKENVVEAYHYLVKKHNLNKFEQYILSGQLINYMPDNFSFFKKIFLFLLTFQFFYLKNSWK